MDRFIGFGLVLNKKDKNNLKSNMDRFIDIIHHINEYLRLI